MNYLMLAKLLHDRTHIVSGTLNGVPLAECRGVVRLRPFRGRIACKAVWEDHLGKQHKLASGRDVIGEKAGCKIDGVRQNAVDIDIKIERISVAVYLKYTVRVGRDVYSFALQAASIGDLV